ncbi:hypothetical protein PILCRDRAFT_73489, partial [Piloderma croceum F 1598]
PGNPGLLDFYIHSQQSFVYEACHSHAGHTPGVGDADMDALHYDSQNVIDAFDTIKSTFGTNIKVILFSHSVGTWLALQVSILFPTISHISKTPNGRSLSWLFRPPLPRIISAIPPVARIFKGLFSLPFRSWPRTQIIVFQSLLSSPSSIFTALSMGHDEMKNICVLDTVLVAFLMHKERIWFYFGEKDGWV